MFGRGVCVWEPSKESRRNGVKEKGRRQEMLVKLRIEGRKKHILGFRHETDVLKVLRCEVLCRTLSSFMQNDVNRIIVFVVISQRLVLYGEMPSEAPTVVGLPAQVNPTHKPMKEHFEDGRHFTRADNVTQSSLCTHVLSLLWWRKYVSIQNGGTWNLKAFWLLHNNGSTYINHETTTRSMFFYLLIL